MDRLVISEDRWRRMEFTPWRRAFYYWALLWGAGMTVIASVGFLLSQLVSRRAGVFKWWSRFWSRTMFLGTGIRVRKHVMSNLDCSASYVFVANHQILVDIPLTALAIPCPFGFVAKSELARIWFLGPAIKYSPSVFVDKSNPRKSYESIKTAGKRIRAGTSVIIFPEGARTYQKDLIEFQRGAFLLALEAGVPIVPVTILDAYRVFNEQQKLAEPGVVHVVVGEPIPLTGLTRADLPDVMETVKDRIESQFNTPFTG